jgi:ABC-type phosphate/phosphonate transport system ATPase subunit
MAAGEVVFDGATATLTDAAARELYGSATSGGAALPPADAMAPIGAFGQPAE